MSELFEALDKTGHLTGELKTRLQIIEDGDWRKVVHVWVVNSREELLIQQRAHKGLWDDLWDVSVGGGVSAGEKPLRSAVRELGEELGLKAKENELEKLGVWETTKPLKERGTIAREFSHTFLLRRDISLSNLTLAKEEVVKVAWKSLHALKLEIEKDDEHKKWVPHPKEYYLGVMAKIERKL